MRVSLNTKILSIVLSFVLLVCVGFIVYSGITTRNYKQLRINEVIATVQYESEQVNKTITRYEQNALDLANIGAGYLAGADHSEALGEKLVLDNFTTFPEAAGGGIWYEPYRFSPDMQRFCFYACDNEEGVRVIVPDFRSEAYDYLTQSWYLEIGGLSREAMAPVTMWTSPYFDDAGTFSLMTTVGSGIFDSEGNFAGMSTVDWQIQSMIDQLSQIRPTENSFVVLASLADDYILTNTESEALQRDAVGASLLSLDWYPDVTLPAGAEVATTTLDIGTKTHLSFARILDNGMALLVQIPQNEIFAEIESNNARFTQLLILVSVLVVIIVLVALTLLISRPLKKIMLGAQAIGAGHLDEKIDIHSRDEIGMLAATFNKMTDELQNHIENSAREYAERERIRGELNVATQIQSSLLPSSFPPGTGTTSFDVVARMFPAKEVGGDFYDFFLVDDNQLVVVIADVSGKGVAAGLFMVVAKALIKNQAQMGKSPAEIFYDVNNQLCENNAAGMFVTCFLGILNIDTGRFVYVNAGHNPPYLRRGEEAYAPLKTTAGFVLGGMEDIPYREQETTLAPGDLLFMYTDGVSEATNPQLELLSDATVLTLCNKYRADSIQALLQHMKIEIDDFAAGAEQADDITMLALAYFGVETELRMHAALLEEITVPAQTAYLDEVQRTIVTHMEKADFSPKDTMSMEIAAEEIFVNICNYAYKDGVGEATVRIAFEEEAQAVSVTFLDKGTPYDPLAREAPDITLSAEERSIGGLGLHMVQNMMDDVRYEYVNGQNALTMVKRKG